MPATQQTTRGSNLDFRQRAQDPALSNTDPMLRSGKKGTAPDETDGSEFRRVNLNGLQTTRFMSNQISTAKYNFLSFIPKFLFEQFRRYANVFFLCIGLLQQIPNVSPTGRYVTIFPLMIILAFTAVKELVEDIKRHRADDKVNNAQVLVLDPVQGQWLPKQWKQLVVGDIVKIVDGVFFPADLVLLASSEPQGMCYIETSNLDGETNLKIRSAPQETFEMNTSQKMSDLRGHIKCELPNRNLYVFNGYIRVYHEDKVPLSNSNVLLRGARLMNTNWIFGVVVYTGHESKLLMNSTQAPLKRSNIDKITNYQIIFLFFLLVLVALFSAVANYLNPADPSYLGDLEDNTFGYNFLTFVILYNNLIPISLQVTLEMVKFVQSYFINWDEKMYHAPTDTFALARTSNLNEELGQIKYVFSDKTGTLTMNVMEFRQCSIAGIRYIVPDQAIGSAEADADQRSSELIQNLQRHQTADVIKDFLVLMSVCHTVIPETRDEGEIFYNASSPDEKALVEGASRFGFTFIARKPEAAVIETVDGQVEEYQVLNVIEFTSTRKRMSVVVRTPDKRILLFTKGADTMVIERLGQGPNQRKYYDATIGHLEDFAREGLRTLCCAVKPIDEKTYEKWNVKFQAAVTSIKDKDAEIEKVADLIERDLTLIGATAIEDKLQDGVPETIAQLLEAEIHVWVLTGDKQETAINIGHSCKLLKEEMPIIILNTSSLDETRTEITEQLQNFRADNAVGRDNDVAIVVDGKSLDFALDHSLRKDFIDLCCSCKSVICCRVSPIQKAEVVELVQEHTAAISLAIGDGANDVAMIQKAHVGVGISGNEGLQAANSSDFAIAQFRFLARLLFVHGAWNYTRISKVILYSFYKNICLYIIELWFAIYNYWSGQVLFERWSIGMYNVFFTFAPPISMGLFDQNCTAETRMRFPSLYRSTQKSEFFNHRVFWRWIANSIIHSIILFWLPMLGYKYGLVWENGKNGDYLAVGNMVYTYVVITVCLKAGLEMDSWNWVTHATIWGSIGFWFLFLIVYSYFWVFGLPLGANMAGMVSLVMTTSEFWLGLLLIPIVTLIPDVALKAIKTTISPTETDQIRRAEIWKKDPSVYVTDPRRGKFTETSSLLRNVRNVFRRTVSRHESSHHDMEMTRGYAFSQEEGGAVSQSEYIRRKSPRQDTSSRRGDGDSLTEVDGFPWNDAKIQYQSSPVRVVSRLSELPSPQSATLKRTNPKRRTQVEPLDARLLQPDDRG